MNKELYKAYLRTPEWKAVRMEVLHLRNHKCERCNSTYRLEVHHKTYRHIFNESPNDLEVLCHSCHKNHHKIQDKKINTKNKKYYPFRHQKKQYASKVFKNLYAR